MTRFSSLPTTIADAATAIRTRTTTSVELVSRALAAADAFDGQWGAFVSRYAEQALAAAEAADEAIRSGIVLGSLHGVPLCVKDIITTAEGPTTAQSLVLEEDWGSGDAPVVARLRSAGGVIVGKAATMEFAVGRPYPSDPFPIPRNPWNPEYWTGGSSSGTGGAVAGGMALGGLGTDTGGSVRIPAAFCGITGLRQTYGLVPKSGCVPLGHSLDVIGPMARTARDCALMLDLMVGWDGSDPTTVDRPRTSYAAGLTGDLTGMRVGVDRLSRFAGREDPALADTFDAALSALAEQGAELVDIELPHYEELTEVQTVTVSGEALAYHLPNLQERWQDYGRATRQTVSGGVFYSAADYVQAQRMRRVGQKALARLFGELDLVVTPTTSIAAPRVDDLEYYYSVDGLRALHTPYWSSVGHPAMSVPMGFNGEGLPMGLQIAGPAFGDQAVLLAGDAFQRATEWHLARPTAVGELVESVEPSGGECA